MPHRVAEDKALPARVGSSAFADAFRSRNFTPICPKGQNAYFIIFVFGIIKLAFVYFSGAGSSVYIYAFFVTIGFLRLGKQVRQISHLVPSHLRAVQCSRP